MVKPYIKDWIILFEDGMFETYTCPLESDIDEYLSSLVFDSVSVAKIPVVKIALVGSEDWINNILTVGRAND